MLLSFDPQTIAPNESRTLESKQTQISMHPRMLLITGTTDDGRDLTAHLVVLDVQIARNSQFTAAGSIPALVFRDVEMLFDIVPACSGARCIIRNLGPVPLTVGGCLEGGPVYR